VKANRVRDFAIYISIGLGLVGFGMWYAESGGKGPSESALKWIGLAVNTPILFGYAASEYRGDWRQARFWVVILGLVAVHLGIFSIILTHVRHWGWLGFIVLFPIEQSGIEGVLSLVGFRPISRDNHP
jgi:hypothetical protein